MEFIETIKDIRAYYRQSQETIVPARYHAEGLVNSWNWLTAPYILRTDQEHRICAKLARIIHNKLTDYEYGRYWKELDSGSLFYIDD